MEPTGSGVSDRPLPPGYPAHLEADVVLADGGTVLVRPIHPEDGPALARFHGRLSAESIYLRYFSPHPRLSEAEIDFLTGVDYRWRMALVAVLGDELVAVARYEGKEGTTDAEVAFLVEDVHQGRFVAHRRSGQPRPRRRRPVPPDRRHPGRHHGAALRHRRGPRPPAAAAGPAGGDRGQLGGTGGAGR